MIDNIDLLGEARVQLILPWAPGFMPWARVATMMAGLERGSFFIPQIGDEVLIAFNHGDIREPFVIGGLWNTLDRPPSALPTDAVNKRIIRTPLQQEIVFDDLLQSITISNLLQFQLALGPESANLASAGASVSLDIAGNVTITGAVSITLQAPTITINGTNVMISGSAGATLNGGANCTIAGAEVNIG
ncbi:MAG TPA: phage baseplate assembly protein V [Stellaceae bacterium]|nr:phage baseplate assembly protein V [Stellaceae bacterium]